MEPLLASKPAGPSSGSCCTVGTGLSGPLGGGVRNRLHCSFLLDNLVSVSKSCPKTLTHPVLWVLPSELGSMQWVGAKNQAILKTASLVYDGRERASQGVRGHTLD